MDGINWQLVLAGLFVVGGLVFLFYQMKNNDGEGTKDK